MSSNAPVATKPGPTMTPEDLAALRTAVRLLEHPGLAARLTNLVGKPIDFISNALPVAASRAIATATAKGLEAALKVALQTMQPAPHAGSQLLHKALATASGAAGGAFGLATLPIELPVSTIIMLRSIADIARSEGENLSEPEPALSCIQVFALGGRTGSANASESGYFAARGLLAKSVTEAARFIAERGVIEEGAPVLLRFIAQVASRFGVVVTQKIAAQTVPVVGALGGAAVNYAFIQIFRSWLEVISPFAGSNESTARTLSGPNMSAWRNAVDGQLSEMS
jgi:hypothetical protein